MSFHVTFEAILRAKGLFTPIAGTKERSLAYSGRNQQTYQSNQRSTRQSLDSSRSTILNTHNRLISKFTAEDEN